MQINEILAKAKKNGVEAVILPTCIDESAKKHVNNYLKPTHERVIENAKEAVENLLDYHTEEKARLDLSTPENHILHINNLYKNYFSLRRTLDGKIAFLIGDWLIECRDTFFIGAEIDRKTAGKWSKFLTENLCSNFGKSTAYTCMQVAKNLNEIRSQNLTFNQLKAAIRIKSKGYILNSNYEDKAEKEILSVIEKQKDKDSLRYYISILSNLRCKLEKMNLEDVNQDEFRLLKTELKKFHSISWNEKFGNLDT